MKNELYIFPDYFSEDAIKQIIANGTAENIAVYRIGKYGENKKVSFLNYYDEVILGLKTVRNPEKYLEKCRNDIDKLSVSCYYDIKDADYYMNVTLKDQYPEKVLLHGVTDKRFGLSQRTSERKEKEGSHTDWWLFKDATPWLAFEEVIL